MTFRGAIEGLSPERRVENHLVGCSMRRGAAPPSSQLGFSGAPGAPGPSMGRSSSSTPCPERVEKFHLAVVMRTLPAALGRVNSGSAVVRSARTDATVCHDLRRGTRLDISVEIPTSIRMPGCNTSKPVYLARGILFDSKIKQLRESRVLAMTAGW